MNTYRIFKALFALSLAIGTPIVLASCGGDDPASPTANGNPPAGTGDFVALSIDGGTQTTYTEASGLPSIDCDPRVDWAFNQIVAWANHTDSSGPNGYDSFVNIMFAAVDTVGTYTVQGDNLQAMFYNGEYYTASPIRPGTSGTVQVIRSDSRIEGTFTITAVDSVGTTSVDFTGRFGIDSGFSLSCP